MKDIFYALFAYWKKEQEKGNILKITHKRFVWQAVFTIPCTHHAQQKVFNLQTFQLFYLPCIRFFIWKLLPWLLHSIPTHLTLLWGSNTLNIEKQMSKIMLIEQAPSWHPSRQDHEGALLHSPAPPLP